LDYNGISHIVNKAEPSPKKSYDIVPAYLTMKVELSLRAMALKNVAGALKGMSDPFAVCTHIATTKGTAPDVLGKTEVVKNTLNPQWTKVFVFDYELGTPMKVAVSIFDEVRKGDNKSMGSAMFDIGELLGARGNTKAKRLKGGGTLFAHLRKSEGSGLLRLKMKGIKLKNVEGMFSKSDPFFELSRCINSAGGDTWDNVYRSQPIKNNLSPDWEESTLPLSTLCGGNKDLPIQVSVYDFEGSGKHTIMGIFETTVNGLVNASTNGAEDMGKAFNIQRKGKDCGSVVVLKAEVAREEVAERMAQVSVSETKPSVFVPGTPSFVDYISGGCELNVVVAIDFTGSNGDPRKPGTLHYRHPDGSHNDYEKAIASIVNILAKYDSDQKFPVVGFGAKYNGVVRHCFQCGPSPEVHGVQGVLDAYHSVFQSGLIMSSPTTFVEAIETAASRANVTQEAAKRDGKQAYTILLILSDGAVTDVPSTKQCLERVSDSPLSVVIVGVGSADFTSMEFLDDSSGKRDIAQFVQYNKHSSSPVDLTSVTLKEIPDQVVGYFQSKCVSPLPPIVTQESDVVVEDEEEIDLSLDFNEDEIVVSGGGTDVWEV
jgi:hypothetical protein